MLFKGRKCVRSMCGLCFNQTNMDTVIRIIYFAIYSALSVSL